LSSPRRRYVQLDASPYQDQSIVVVEDDPYIGGALDAFLGDKNIVQTFTSSEDRRSMPRDTFGGVDVSSSISPAGQGRHRAFSRIEPQFPKAKFILITGEMSSTWGENARTWL